MPTAIKMQFLTGRYHATPWDSHPNEGVTEPFPAPWRILRALVAVSYRLDPQPRELLASLVERLAEQPPVYWVPPSTEGHVRQSVPFEPKGKDWVQRRRLIDAFRCYSQPFDDRPETAVYAVWSVELPEAERALLAELCDRVPHLGRSEAWVQMSLAAPPDEHHFVKPSEQATVNLMAPLSVAELQGFLAGVAALGLKKAEKAILPGSVLAALDIDYVTVQKQGWSQVPGSRLVGYDWPIQGGRSRSFSLGASPATRRRSDAGARESTWPRLARFRIDADILPPAAALELTDRLHRALTKLSDGLPVFSGKQDGNRLEEGRSQHAKFLPEFDRRGRVVAVMLYARMGFDPDAQRALGRLRRLERAGDRRDWFPSLEYLDADWGEPSGRVWVSRTPLVLPRWPKRAQDELGSQVERLLVYEGVAVPVMIEKLKLDAARRRLNRIPLYRPQQRDRDPRRVFGQRFWLRLTFAERVAGPLAIGWNCHYGLGLFERADG